MRGELDSEQLQTLQGRVDSFRVLGFDDVQIDSQAIGCCLVGLGCCPLEQLRDVPFSLLEISAQELTFRAEEPQVEREGVAALPTLAVEQRDSN